MNCEHTFSLSFVIINQQELAYKKYLYKRKQVIKQKNIYVRSFPLNDFGELKDHSIITLIKKESTHRKPHTHMSRVKTYKHSCLINRTLYEMHVKSADHIYTQYIHHTFHTIPQFNVTLLIKYTNTHLYIYNFKLLRIIIIIFRPSLNFAHFFSHRIYLNTGILVLWIWLCLRVIIIDDRKSYRDGRNHNFFKLTVSANIRAATESRQKPARSMALMGRRGSKTGVYNMICVSVGQVASRATFASRSGVGPEWRWKKLSTSQNNDMIHYIHNRVSVGILLSLSHSFFGSFTCWLMCFVIYHCECLHSWGLKLS